MHSQRPAEQVRRWQLHVPELRETQAVPFLARPWEFGMEAGRELCKRLCVMLVQARSAEHRIRRSDMRTDLDESAASGGKAAFLSVKGADLTDAASGLNTASIARVLQEHQAFWGDMWQDEGGTNEEGKDWLKLIPDGVPCSRIPVDQLRAVARAFPPTTSCPDVFPAQTLAVISEELLEALSAMGVLWEAAAAWPTRESLAMTVMNPKVTSCGVRPITLFRTVIRIMARAKAWRATKWLEQHSPSYLNTCRGRRVGDAMWRTQLRALLGARDGQHSAEVLVDLHKAFELVNRGKLIEAAVATGYPCDALVWGFGMYAWPRRLVYRGCVTQAVLPPRGIAAGSAFATTELWLLLCCPMGRLARRFSEVQWCLHVDDLSGTVRVASHDEVIHAITEFVKEVRREITDECDMLIADHKTASSEGLAEAVVGSLGGGI